MVSNWAVSNWLKNLAEILDIEDCIHYNPFCSLTIEYLIQRGGGIRPDETRQPLAMLNGANSPEQKFWKMRECELSTLPFLPEEGFLDVAKEEILGNFKRRCCH